MLKFQLKFLAALCVEFPRLIELPTKQLSALTNRS
jgi:hypothetical protein